MLGARRRQDPVAAATAQWFPGEPPCLSACGGCGMKLGGSAADLHLARKPYVYRILTTTSEDPTTAMPQAKKRALSERGGRIKPSGEPGNEQDRQNQAARILEGADQRGRAARTGHAPLKHDSPGPDAASTTSTPLEWLTRCWNLPTRTASGCLSPRKPRILLQWTSARNGDHSRIPARRWRLDRTYSRIQQRKIGRRTRMPPCLQPRAAVATTVPETAAECRSAPSVSSTARRWANQPCRRPGGPPRGPPGGSVLYAATAIRGILPARRTGATTGSIMDRLNISIPPAPSSTLVCGAPIAPSIPAHPNLGLCRHGRGHAAFSVDTRVSCVAAGYRGVGVSAPTMRRELDSGA